MRGVVTVPRVRVRDGERSVSRGRMEKSANKAPAQKRGIGRQTTPPPPRLSGLPVWARATDLTTGVVVCSRTWACPTATAVLLDDVELRGEIVHPLRR